MNESPYNIKLIAPGIVVTAKLSEEAIDQVIALLLGLAQKPTPNELGTTAPSAGSTPNAAGVPTAQEKKEGAS